MPPKDFHKLRTVILLLGILILTIYTWSCSGSTSIGVFAAGGAKPVLDEICQKFQENHKIKMGVSYGGGGEILSKLILAKCCDVFIAPEQIFMDSAKKKGAINPQTIRSIAYMVPVIAVPKGNPGNIRNIADLARPGVSVAITRPETTLLGKYAPEIFDKAGLAEEIAKNIQTYASDPNNLLTMLFMGQVDAGIIWHFYDDLANGNIETIPLHFEELTGIGEMQAAVSSYTKDGRTAQRFIDFIASSEGKTLFAKNGYAVNMEEVRKICR
jgi:molybdate transport system substrate-binding protein